MIYVGVRTFMQPLAEKISEESSDNVTMKNDLYLSFKFLWWNDLFWNQLEILS
jgi:hypothetical protein